MFEERTCILGEKNEWYIPIVFPFWYVLGMFDESGNPDPEHDLFSQELRVSLERVGDTNALALVMSNIPIQPKLQEFLYGEDLSSSYSPRLDYVNIATDDIVRKATSTPSHIDDLLSTANRRYAFQDHNAQRSAFVTEIAKAVELNEYSEEISPEDREVFNQLREVLKENPSKPLLVISGHGSRGESFEIGESTGENYARADDVIRELVKQREYAAVVLIACKPNKNSVLSDPGVPLFFADGFGGLGQKKRFSRK